MSTPKTNFIGLAVFAAAAWVTLSSSGTAFAATKTWTGTTCNPSVPSSNCNWSTGTNWLDGTAPVSGDDISIFSDATNPTWSDSTYNDIANLSIHNITVSGYSASPNDCVRIQAAQGNATPLTITGNVSYTAPAAAAPSGWYKAVKVNLGQSIILGADSTFSQVQLDDNSKTIALNGHALSFLRTSGDTSSTTSLNQLITGAGTLNINIPSDSALFMNSVNTYSGTTNINSVDYIDGTPRPNIGMFGTSTINLSGHGRILFHGDGTQTISNVINVTPPTVTGTFLANQLEFWSGSSVTTYTVPNIHLLGNARFGVNNIAGVVTVNLAGIVTNGHCVQYGTDNYYVSSFQNGPSACTVAVASGGVGAPPTTTTAAVVKVKVPDTGFSMLLANPLLTLVASIAAGLALIVLGKKSLMAKR